MGDGSGIVSDCFVQNNWHEVTAQLVAQVDRDCSVARAAIAALAAFDQLAHVAQEPDVNAPFRAERLAVFIVLQVEAIAFDLAAQDEPICPAAFAGVQALSWRFTADVARTKAEAHGRRSEGRDGP